HPFTLELFAASGLDAGTVETERYVLETVLDGLDDSSEELLRTFAVLRRPARSPEALGATLSQLRRLVRRALLHHRDDGYLIHDLVKEFFLRPIGVAARRAARDGPAGRTPGNVGEARRALGGVERKLGNLHAAIAHLGRATGVLPNGSRERVRALTDLGVALIARADIPRAKARLLEAAATGRRATREDAVIQINLGIVTSREGDPRTAAATFAR